MESKQSGRSCEKLTRIDVEKLAKSTGKLCYTISGKESNKILDALHDIKAAIGEIGFSDNVSYAVTQFIIECVHNAMKARGSKILTDKYGSFEKLLETENNPRDVIDNTIIQSYNDTNIMLIWENSAVELSVSIANNTCLNEYLACRLEKSLYRDHEITFEEIQEIASDNSIYNTKASGMGLGLWMVVNSIKDFDGKISYYSNSDFTTVTLNIPKKK